MKEHQQQQMQYHRIGAGACGTVWARSCDDFALKRHDGSPARSLINDHQMHLRLLQALERLSQTGLQPTIRIPRCFRFVTADEQWWADHLCEFPPGYLPCDTLITQRIPPFSEQVRALLVENYCPSEMAKAVLASESNKHCLIRPYLGRRRTQDVEHRSSPRLKTFSLRNYPLHEDQFVDLNISSEEMEVYAGIMGEALATMHWLAEIDGNDVEFVLAPVPQLVRGSQTLYNCALGEHRLWMLDFDLCRRMTMDEAGVRQAVTSFWRNDPFYPRPRSRPLWRAFRDAYLAASRSIMKLNEGEYRERQGLAEMFVKSIEDAV